MSEVDTLRQEKLDLLRENARLREETYAHAANAQLLLNENKALKEDRDGLLDNLAKAREDYYSLQQELAAVQPKKGRARKKA